MPDVTKAVQYRQRLRPALRVKTDLVDTKGARPSNQDGERFLTNNLCCIDRLGAGKDYYRLGVPTV